jgi:hypothetical protein
LASAKNTKVLAAEPTEYDELNKRLIAVRGTSAKMGAEVHFHMISPILKGFYCMENCARSIVVGSDGSVSACVMLQIPAEGMNYHYFIGSGLPEYFKEVFFLKYC